MRRTRHILGASMLAALLGLVPAAAQDDGEKDFEGSVELLYRDVNVNGSQEKYNEDIELTSGVRLSDLRMSWNHIDSSTLDFLRLEASGLGGDPYERAALRMGRKDRYDLDVSHVKQTYLYNLFDLVDDQDGSTWDSERRFARLGLTYHLTDKIDLLFGFDEVRREGSSLFMKTIETEVFRLQTPLDQQVRRYTVGGRFELGKVDLVFRQTLRRYDYRFDNTTSSDGGLGQDPLVTLDSYDWVQRDRGDTDLTSLKVAVPLGRRVHLTATAFGTFLGDEQVHSRVALDATGTSFRGTCSVTGDVCTATDPCDAGVQGNVCVADPFEITDGTSEADIDADYTVLEADVSVRILDNLDFHFQGRTLDREVRADQLRDLDGNGVPDDAEGTVMDSTPGSTTRVDYTRRSVTGLFEYLPIRKVRLRAGYRWITRDLRRGGFELGTNDFRNTDFESDPDETLILGIVLIPVEWFRLNADYEEGDIAQAFTAVGSMERDRLRVQARFVPRSRMQIGLGYLDFENRNTGFDFRFADAADCRVSGADIDSGCWRTDSEGTTYSADFRHDANEHVDYWFRWARHDTESLVRIRYDTDILFNSAENGDSIYDNASTSWAGQVNFRWAGSWHAFLGARISDSDGSDDVLDSVFFNRMIIGQDFSDFEGGLTYSFSDGLYVGARYRLFDYDDANDRLDYDGHNVSIVAGLAF